MARMSITVSGSYRIPEGIACPIVSHGHIGAERIVLNEFAARLRPASGRWGPLSDRLQDTRLDIGYAGGNVEDFLEFGNGVDLDAH